MSSTSGRLFSFSSRALARLTRHPRSPGLGKHERRPFGAHIFVRPRLQLRFASSLKTKDRHDTTSRGECQAGRCKKLQFPCRQELRGHPANVRAGWSRLMVTPQHIAQPGAAALFEGLRVHRYRIPDIAPLFASSAAIAWPDAHVDELARRSYAMRAAPLHVRRDVDAHSTW